MRLRWLVMSVVVVVVMVMVVVVVRLECSGRRDLIELIT